MGVIAAASMAKQIVEMVVETATMELPDTKTLKLRWPEGYDIEFKTGQFITCTLATRRRTSGRIRFRRARWTVVFLKSRSNATEKWGRGSLIGGRRAINFM